ncbi:MAG TPA: NADH-quinone oxidoreductase subunit M [Ohtaekwangia sp.]|nr:NADH-quinone oxidoreductase subunit M [Ohtaekwangia sp.]
MLTVFLIFFPLLIAVLLFLLKPQQAKVWALGAAVVELIASLVLAFGFDAAGGIQYAIDIPWVATMGLRFSVGMDGISLLLVLLTTVLVPFIILSSFRQDYAKPATFYGLILTMQMALVGVFTARDGLLFYLFWEAALIPIYFICLIWGGEDRGRITLKFFIYTLAGSLFMLIGLVYLYFLTPGQHTFDIEALYAAGRALPAFEQGLIFWAMFVAFAIKMPVFPFHTWQPDTYTTAPVQGTMLLSGIMLKMGIYGVIRWLLPLVPLGVHQWGLTAVIISVIGIVYGSCIAIVQRDIKRLIAYSSIAHVGLISAGIFTLTTTGVQGAMIQMLSHGIIVFALFFIVDIIHERTRTHVLQNLGGIRNVAPVFATVFIIVMLGSVALPFTSGFVGEFLLINSLVQYKLVIGIVAASTIILGAVYMLRTFQKSMSGEVNAVTATFTDLTNLERWVLFPITGLIILLGVYPAPILNLSASAVADIIEIYSNYSASVQ